MSERLPPIAQWCPPEITDAAVPIQAAADLLKGLRQEVGRLQDFAGSSPSREVRDAFEEFVVRWEQATFVIGGSASSLATNLRAAAVAYAGTEADLARRMRLDNPDREGRPR